jgi:signal peptidase I
VAVLLAGLIRTFAFQTFWIPSTSMVPTLDVYDRVLVQKAFFSWRDVREGDIVVFGHPPLDQCGGPHTRLRHRAARGAAGTGDVPKALAVLTLVM